MYDDPIVSETRQIRDAYSASLGHDLARIVADLQSRQGTDGRQLVRRPRRSPPHQPPVAPLPAETPPQGTILPRG